MSNETNSELVIVYMTESNTAESEKVKLLVQAADIRTDGLIDRSKVLRLAASNEVENNRAVLDPFVVDLNGNIIN